MGLWMSLMRFHAGWSEQMAEHDYRNVYEKTTAVARSNGVTLGPGTRVLDFGCGQRYPFAMLARAAGAEVTAVDVEYVGAVSLPRFAAGTARVSGPRRALRASARRVMFDPAYYGKLRELAGSPLPAEGIRFVIHDPACARYDLESDHFDIVETNAVFEHIEDIDGVAAEIARVMAPGGVLWALYHNYYSLSGGHDLDWARPSTNPHPATPPWGHLRGSGHPPHVYLNRARPEDFQRAFGRYLRIVSFEGVDEHHEPGGLEGVDYMTPEIRAELAEYDEELLLTRAYLMVAVKDSGGVGDTAAGGTDASDDNVDLSGAVGARVRR